MAVTTSPFGPTNSNPYGINDLTNNGTFSLGDTSIGLLNGNPSFDSKIASSSDVKASGERLEFARPRSTSADRSNRGTHAYICLLTSKEQSSLYASGSSPRTQEIKDTASKDSLIEGLKSMTTGGSTGYDKFLLTGIQGSIDEKIQIMEVFGDNEVSYYFGRAPMVFSISGILVDSPDNSWFTDWLNLYAGALRGSQLAMNYELLKLVLPNMTLIGCVTNMGWSQESQNDVAIPFRFQFHVKSLIPTPVIAVGQGLNNAASLLDFSKESTFTKWSEINSLRQQGAVLTGVIQNPLSTLGDYGSAMRNFGSGVSANLGLKATSSAASEFLDGLSSKIGGGLSGLSGIFTPITSGLEGLRASIFSPIYGVMNSLTKLVRNIFGGTGLSSIISQLTAPIKNILGDITRIASQAVALVGLVTAGISGLGRGVTSGFGMLQSYQSALRAIGKASGCITSAPQTTCGSLKSLFNGGSISSSAGFLQSNPKHGLSRTPTLSARPSSSSSTSASLSGNKKTSTQLAILGSGAKHVSVPGAAL